MLKQFYVEREKDLLHNGNGNAFYKYVNNRLDRTHSRPLLLLKRAELTDNQAVKALCAEFCSNFASLNSDKHHSTDLLTDADSDQSKLLNCSSTNIKLALAPCANSSVGPDGFSFKLIKAISAELTLPLLITYQQFFSQGKFPKS